MIPHKLLTRLCSDVPFLSEGALLAAMMNGQTPEQQAAEHPGMRMMRDRLKPQAEIKGNVAILPIEGVLARKPDPWEMAFYGVEDSGAVLDMVEAATYNKEVEGILLDIDSPGGFLTGGPEVADAVKAASKIKPVVAWSGGSMASLAYWIGAQASELIASRSAVVGSIGVYMALTDYSKLFEAAGVKIEVFKNKEATFKAAGLPGTALSEDQRSHFQERIQASFSEFKRAVKSARPDASDDSMRGQTFTGKEGRAAGLVDRIGDRAFALGVLRQAIKAKG
jgi:signal peptide peptidase SppA